MKSTSRVVAGMALVLALLLGLSALTVSAQQPTATPTATSVPGATPTPAQAPPAAVAGANMDDPGIAATLGNAVAAIPANTAQWFRFDYVTPVNEFPRNTVTIRLVNGVNNGLGFEVWSPERMQGNWWENTPVGRGTQEVLPNCTRVLPDDTVVKCTTDDLTWVGGFAVSAPYYVRVVNDTDSALAPQLIFSGSGLSQCAGPAQAQAQPTGQGFTQVLCGPEAVAAALTPAPAAAPTLAPAAPGAATPAASPTAAATSTPVSAPTVAATSTPAATSAATATSAGATPAGAATGTPAAGAAPAGMVTGLAVAQNATMGPYMTDSQGRTLYAFTRDTGTTSNCTGACAVTWPPAMVSGTPQAGSGLDASKIGTITRSDGGTQVTYSGHPLYYFSADMTPGSTNGQGVGGLWFTVSPAGTLNQTGGAGGTTTPGAVGTGTPGGTPTP